MGSKCESCGYRMQIKPDWGCQYILITGKPRPCPPGLKCTVKETPEAVKEKYGVRPAYVPLLLGVESEPIAQLERLARKGKK